MAEPTIGSLFGTRPIHLIAAGKAAPHMAAAAVRFVPGFIMRSMAVGTDCPIRLPDGIEWHQAGHPVPNDGSVAAGTRALEIAGAAGQGAILLVLLSGGASALLCAPADGLTLEDKRAVTELLLRAGADIHALNTVRKHLSRVKGGRLAAATDALTVTLAVSDVIGDDLSVIASGPTVPDPSTFLDALAVLDRLEIRDRLPVRAAEILARGARGDIPDTPKSGDARLCHSVARVIGSRLDAIEGARAAAEALGYAVVVHEEPVVGEARVAALRHLDVVAALARGLRRPACVLASGETTVRVTGHGRGGRNQEFAVAAAPGLARLGPAVVAGSFGTDGIDGPTDAAGGMTDTMTLTRACAAGAGDPARSLENNDTYSFLGAAGDLVMTGPTGTNVGDIQIFLLGSA